MLLKSSFVNFNLLSLACDYCFSHKVAFLLAIRDIKILTKTATKLTIEAIPK